LIRPFDLLESFTEVSGGRFHRITHGIPTR